MRYVCLINHCITSLRVTLFFCCVFQEQMWSLKYQQVILRTKIYPNRASCLMRTTWSRIWLTSGGIRHTHPCFVRPDCTVPKLCKKQDFSPRALLALRSVVRFCLSLLNQQFHIWLAIKQLKLCQEIVVRFAITNCHYKPDFFSSPKLGDYANAVKWGERALEAAGAWAMSAWKKTSSENPWFCVFFSNGSGISTTSCCISIRSWHIECHRKTQGFHFLCPGKGEREEHYALVYLANLYFEAASHYKTLPAAKDPISQPHFVCPCRPCFKVLPWTLKEPADQWYLV